MKVRDKLFLLCNDFLIIADAILALAVKIAGYIKKVGAKLECCKKKIRTLVKKYLPVKCIGGRIYVERAALENLLSDPDREFFSLK